ncbi:rho gtpase-activating protein 68f [Anaeramoeba ignava]|uniref:Rho gtpase-activating protein 68f n=1 Tax=Anaeramoeba ignava TaxID=1746090 RepID=A0A9Q0R9X0_ANAIG|nr:rho gtpase-activating protein 68f [Anaeramoeba ignava]|eukprot:Anaeramoba_ignava/c18302_g1_i1.p1 GENE.c18302_g1_i1~~c18302_g1_i1.p1  ORF type:complete len:268 (-),score=74.49 c18302_g1_i1:171-974(-)
MFSKFRKKKQEIDEAAIPSVVLITTAFLREKGFSIEYIFRIPGRVSDVEELLQKLSKNEEVDLSSYNIHIIASVLKSFLRNYDPPLIVYKLYKPFLKIQKKGSDKKNDQLVKLLLLLPDEHQLVLKHVFEFLAYIAQHSDKNLMTASNLATVFGPNILRLKKSNPKRDAKDFDLIRGLVQYIIENNKEIFSGLEKFRHEIKSKQKSKFKANRNLSTSDAAEIKTGRLTKSQSLNPPHSGILQPDFSEKDKEVLFKNRKLSSDGDDDV